ncbi:MAG: hypothetical protein QOE93_671 [Actinomycetota bacterium]|jgi:glutathione synthase/RimK-type ligase-like ATP-grasp enzyme|nr:hypothetical protein [Actinomycetota bacterium]
MGLQPRVAIVAHRASDDADATDLYPDADWPLLAAALADAGADATPVSWDDPDIDWDGFDLVVINSTWDSVDRPHEYLAWARRTARSTTLMNPLPAIEWNIDKTYLRTLESRGVPIVPTEWVVDGGRWEPPPYEFVVKPSISAGGRETARYQPEEASVAVAHVRRLLDSGQTAMVQPYVAGVDADGEAKLVFIAGEFSHAVRVGALLDAGAGVVDRPWERVVSMEAMTPTPLQLDTAHQALAAVEAEVATPLLYARVDSVPSATGQPLLTEVELIDPSLLLRLAPFAAGRYAEAITVHAERCRHRA